MSVVAACAGIPSGSLAQGDAPATVHELVIDGVITPLTARYLDREVEVAAHKGAAAVVLRLDTPGGLESSMRDMVQTMFAAPLPIAIYVAPSGARAASAGMFLTIAAHVAAMAPGTNIGAAHPVALGEQQAAKEEGEEDPRIAKAVHDAAALARTVATERGRNAAWAEKAVRESVSITADEARRLNVVDLLAGDRDELLRLLDGRKVRLATGDVTLKTAGARVVEAPMSLAERLLQAITDPNIAYLLLSLGFIGLIAELYNPGMMFPGLTGVISLIVAFTALGSLPLNWAGLALVALGLVLLALDLQTEGLGILAAFGLVAFVLGSLILYRPFEPVSPALPAVRVHPGLIAAIAAAFSAFFFFVVRAVLQVRRLPVATGVEALVGRSGTAISDLAPRGTVKIEGERWTAIVDRRGAREAVRVGTPVRVTGVEGVTLKVEPLGPPGSALPQT